MARLLGCAIIFLLAHVKVLESGAQHVSQKFKEYGVVPDVIPVAPSKLLKVVYPDDVRVLLGNKIVITKLLPVPFVDYRADPDCFYTLAMVGNAYTFLHWLVGNIPGNDVENGEVIASYFPPTDPPYTGPDYYIFLVYKQPGRIEFNKSILDFTTYQRRIFTSIDKIAKENGLGNPLYGCFCEGIILSVEVVL